ncbi:MAG: RNA ligase [Sulfobacillus sp.]
MEVNIFPEPHQQDMRHPARIIPFEALLSLLELECYNGNVSVQESGDGLRLYCYTKHCVYTSAWNPINILARGLILNPEKGMVIATPFPKFFNYGELQSNIPSIPFQVFEKLDGSLIIVFHDGTSWRTATKGSFTSSQALWAASRLGNMESHLTPGTTYLFEAIYKENRIVVKYDYEDLVLLTAYAGDGLELSHEEILDWSQKSSCRTANRLHCSSVSDLLTRARTLPLAEEGWVVRYDNGLRVKIKGEEYLKIHSMLNNLTPLHVWESMRDGHDVWAAKKELPEEFWLDFDNLVNILEKHAEQWKMRIETLHQHTLAWSDKTLGIRRGKLPDPERNFIFGLRKAGNWETFLSGKGRNKFFMLFRPTGNILDDYTPTRQLIEVQQS